MSVQASNALSPASLAPERGRSRRRTEEAIYESIYQAVLTQRLPPGTKLPEISLGEIFGVSRSVVRKALTRLAADHIIRRRPNQMAVVSRPSVDETREIFEARRLIEGEVVRLLARAGLSPEQLRVLRDMAEREARAHREGHHEERVHHSMNFHRLLADTCQNRVIGGILRDLATRTSIVIALYKVPGITACYMGDDHNRILDALERGDGEAAARMVEDHMARLEQRIALNDGEVPVDLAAILRS